VDGAELRKRREALGLSQIELARQLGVDNGTVSRWERGELNCHPLLSLALEAIERRQDPTTAT